MPEVIIPLGTPVADLSVPGHANGDEEAGETENLGGLYGPTPSSRGDLTTDDGETTYFSMWGVGKFDSHPPGADAFQYRPSPPQLPPGAVITSSTLEIVARAVELTEGVVVLWPPPGAAHGERMSVAAFMDRFNSGELSSQDIQIWIPEGQGYATPRASFKGAGGLFASVGFPQVTNFGFTHLSVLTPHITPEMWRTAATVDPLLITFAADTNLGTNLPRGEMRVTQAFLRIVYSGGRSTAHLRVHPRSDGRGVTGGKRAWPPGATWQASNRRGPGSVF